MANATLNDFRNAILAGSNLGVPGAGTSPNMGGAGTANADVAIGHLQGLAKSSFQLPATQAGSTGAGAQGQLDDDAAKAAAKLRLQEVADQLDKATSMKQDLQDPNKYIRQVNKTGGYDFFAPDGKAITAQQYADVQGKHTTDVLKGSQDIHDQEFLQDYDDVVKIGQVMQSGNKKELQKLYDADPGSKGQPGLKDRIGNMTYSDIVKQFRNSYPNYFGGQTMDVGNASFGGKKPNELGGGNNFLQKIMGFFGS